MAKAILELPKMPESCRGGCPFYKVCDICDILSSWNYHMPVYTPSEGRRPDCPLKLVDTDMLEKQKPKKVIETPDKHKYGYCPVCGRIYWDKCHIGNYCDQCGQRLEVEP